MVDEIVLAHCSNEAKSNDQTLHAVLEMDRHHHGDADTSHQAMCWDNHDAYGLTKPHTYFLTSELEFS